MDSIVSWPYPVYLVRPVNLVPLIPLIDMSWLSVVGDQQFDISNEHIEIGTSKTHVRRGEAMTPDIRRDMLMIVIAERYQS